MYLGICIRASSIEHRASRLWSVIGFVELVGADGWLDRILVSSPPTAEWVLIGKRRSSPGGDPAEVAGVRAQRAAAQQCSRAAGQPLI